MGISLKPFEFCCHLWDLCYLNGKTIAENFKRNKEGFCSFNKRQKPFTLVKGTALHKSSGSLRGSILDRNQIAISQAQVSSLFWGKSQSKYTKSYKSENYTRGKQKWGCRSKGTSTRSHCSFHCFCQKMFASFTFLHMVWKLKVTVGRGLGNFTPLGFRVEGSGILQSTSFCLFIFGSWFWKASSHRKFLFPQ